VDVLLDVGTATSLVVVLLWTLTQLRDEAVYQGWVSRSSALGRMTTRVEAGKITPVLRELGVIEEDVRDIRRMRDVRRADRRIDHIERPDIALIERLKEWTFELQSPYSFRGSSYYIDTMGAVHHRRTHEPSLAQILLSWITLLQHRAIIGDFTCVLTPKEGNPILAHDLCNRVLGGRKHAIICKGQSDPARVSGPNGGPHPMDFEGLRAVLRQPAMSTMASPLAAIAVDDNCTSGTTLCEAIARYNEFVTSSDPAARALAPISDAVVLFRVMTPGQADRCQQLFEAINVRLHALVALGPSEMKLLVDAQAQHGHRRPATLVDRCKSDRFACEQSTRLLRSHKSA
jgi:hypothetical protein